MSFAKGIYCPKLKPKLKLKQRYCKLTRDMVFAARDYLRISRAATDATGASLTM